jgi:hypothetical protein
MSDEGGKDASVRQKGMDDWEQRMGRWWHRQEVVWCRLDLGEACGRPGDERGLEVGRHVVPFLAPGSPSVPSEPSQRSRIDLRACSTEVFEIWT